MYAACFGINGLMAENCKQPQNVPYWPTYKPHISSRDQSWVATFRLINHFSTAYNQDVTESLFVHFYEFRINYYLNLSSDKTKTSKVSQLHHKFLHQNSLRAVLRADEYTRMIWYDMIWYDMIWYDVFINCNWVDTQWKQYSTHLHTNNTQNDTKQTIHRTTQQFRIVRAVPRLG